MSEERIEELDRKALAQAKLRARKLRIVAIRRWVAIGASLLVVMFSGVIFGRSLTLDTGSTQTVSQTSSQPMTEESDDDQSGFLPSTSVTPSTSTSSDLGSLVTGQS